MMKCIMIRRIGHVQAANSTSLNEIFAFRVFKTLNFSISDTVLMKSL